MYIAHISKEGKIQPCEEHCRNVAELAAAKLKSIGLYNTAYIAGALHDSGKFSDEFNSYIQKAAEGENVKKGSVIHTFAGCSYILNKYHDENNLGYESVTAEIIAYAIAAHHGLFDLVNDSRENGFMHRLNKQPEYDAAALDRFINICMGQNEIQSLFEKSVEEIQNHFSCIGSMARNSDKICFYMGLTARLLLSSIIDADRTDTYDFMADVTNDHAVETDWRIYADRVNNYVSSKACVSTIQRARHELSDICAEFAENPTGIYQLNLPTGAGKTLSGMRFALEHAARNGKTHIFYIAPLISILEQNVAVIKDSVGNPDMVLEHHSNVMDEEDYESVNGSPRQLLCETWDSPIIVTTLVQFLNALFGGRGAQIRRFSSLTNSVIILDEVQTVPWHMLSMFNLAMNFLSKCCNSTILLCSATQPSFAKTSHPMIVSNIEFLNDAEASYYSGVFKRSEIVYDGDFRLDEIPDYIKNLAQVENSILVICNKKNESEYLFDNIKIAGTLIFHLSGAMCMCHREEVLEELAKALDSDKRVICIATQVIEAGVDISFGTVVRFMAGLDSVVQANGRCNRNGEREDGCFTHIIACSDESLVKLEEIKRAKDAMNALLYDYKHDREEINYDLGSQAAVKKYYSNLYNDLAKSEGYWDYPIKGVGTLFDLLGRNKKWFRESTGYFMNQAFKTAAGFFKPIDSDSISVLVPYGKGKDIITDLCSERARSEYKYAKGLLEQAKRYTVSVMLFQGKKLSDIGAIYRIYDDSICVLREEFYDFNTGIRMGKEKEECSILIL